MFILRVRTRYWDDDERDEEDNELRGNQEDPEIIRCRRVYKSFVKIKMKEIVINVELGMKNVKDERVRSSGCKVSSTKTSVCPGLITAGNYNCTFPSGPAHHRVYSLGRMSALGARAPAVILRFAPH